MGIQALLSSRHGQFLMKRSIFIQPNVNAPCEISLSCYTGAQRFRPSATSRLVVFVPLSSYTLQSLGYNYDMGLNGVLSRIFN